MSSPPRKKRMKETADSALIAARKITERVKAISDLSQQALQDSYLAGYQAGLRDALNLPEEESEAEKETSGV